MYGVGNNEDGLLCLPETELRTYKPVKINFELKNEENKIVEFNGKIIDISCGTVHNLALSEGGDVFSWGSFQGGQLGLSSELIFSKDLNNKKNNLYVNIPSLLPYFLKIK